MSRGSWLDRHPAAADLLTVASAAMWLLLVGVVGAAFLT